MFLAVAEGRQSPVLIWSRALNRSLPVKRRTFSEFFCCRASVVRLTKHSSDVVRTFCVRRAVAAEHTAAAGGPMTRRGERRTEPGEGLGAPWQRPLSFPLAVFTSGNARFLSPKAAVPVKICVRKLAVLQNPPPLRPWPASAAKLGSSTVADMFWVIKMHSCDLFLFIRLPGSFQQSGAVSESQGMY